MALEFLPLSGQPRMLGEGLKLDLGHVLISNWGGF